MGKWLNNITNIVYYFKPVDGQTINLLQPRLHHFYEFLYFSNQLEDKSF